MELPTENMLPFLGMVLRKDSQNITTSVYVKPTNTGLLLQYNNNNNKNKNNNNNNNNNLTAIIMIITVIIIILIIIIIIIIVMHVNHLFATLQSQLKG